MDGRQRRRFRREVLRRRSAQERRAADTQAAQARAEMARAFRRHQRRKVLAGGLAVAGVSVGVSHWLQHLGAYQLLSPGWADLLIGYPTAFALVVAGSSCCPADLVAHSQPVFRAIPITKSRKNAVGARLRPDLRRSVVVVGSERRRSAMRRPATVPCFREIALQSPSAPYYCLWS
jgi:hypothetical protein